MTDDLADDLEEEACFFKNPCDENVECAQPINPSCQLVLSIGGELFITIEDDEGDLHLFPVALQTTTRQTLIKLREAADHMLTHIN